MSKNKSELQAELTALGKQLDVEVALDQKNEDLQDDIDALQEQINEGVLPESPSQLDDKDETEAIEGESVSQLEAVVTFETRLQSGEKFKKVKGQLFTCESELAALLVTEQVAKLVTA